MRRVDLVAARAFPAEYGRGNRGAARALSGTAARERTMAAEDAGVDHHAATLISETMPLTISIRRPIQRITLTAIELPSAL